MLNEDHIGEWRVDLEARLASSGRNVLSFDRRADRTLDIAFVAGGDCSLEEQCLIAGEATAAIKAKLDC